MAIEIQHVQYIGIVLLDRTGSYDCEFSWAKSFNQLVSKVD